MGAVTLVPLLVVSSLPATAAPAAAAPAAASPTAASPTAASPTAASRLSVAVPARGGSFSPLDFPGAAHTWPEGVTDSGVVFGQFETAGGRYEGFVLRRGRWRVVNDPAASWNLVVGVLPSGVVVGDELTGSTMRGFEERRGRFVPVRDPRETKAPTVLGYGGTSIGAAGEDGLLVGSFAEGTVTRAFVFDRGRFSTVSYPGRLGRSFTELTGTDSSGDLLVGLASDGERWQAFVLRHGRFEARNAPSQPHTTGAETVLNGVSPDGEEIAGAWTTSQFGGVEHGFVIVKGRFVGLSDPEGTFGTEPTGVNDRGVVVGYVLTASGASGFMFRPA